MQSPECCSQHIRKKVISEVNTHHICVDCGRQFIDVETAPKDIPISSKLGSLKIALLIRGMNQLFA